MISEDNEIVLSSQAMPPDPSAETEVAEFAGQLFFRLWRASHTRTSAALQSIGLTPALFAILNYLQAHEGAIQQQIGSAMGIDPSTMVSLVDQLERAELAERRPHPRDRRAREIRITPKGRRTLKRARKLAQQVERDVLQGLSPAERRELLTLLRKAFATAPPQPLWSSEEETGDGYVDSAR
jgi:MarR family transcriptional regulator, lower aerobic nicotinate degradation pathway regulator